MSLNVSRIPDQGGAVTFWRLDAEVHLPTLKTELEALGIGGSAPSPRTNLAVLKEAISNASKRLKRQHVVIPLDDRSGFALVSANADGSVEPGSTWGKVANVIKLNGDSYLDMDPMDLDFHNELIVAYRASKEFITAPMAGKALVDICKTFNGACLRPAGGIYWLPDHSLEAWELVAKAFDKASPKGSTVYLIRHKLDFDSVRAVYDGILAETEAALATMKAEILSGELGEKALAWREQECARLANRLTDYEAYLGVTFEHTKKLAVEMTDAQAFAIIHQQVLQPELVTA